MVTFLPFNVIHHHAEHDHELAQLNKHQHQNHHCELDEYFCGTAEQKDCQHHHHIAKTITKCFSCTFHFVKNYHSSSSNYTVLVPERFTLHKPFLNLLLHKATVLLSNKGPPIC